MTTTLTYKVYPSAAAGINRVGNTGATAWVDSAYTELVPVNTITSTFYICGITFMYPYHSTFLDNSKNAEIIIGSGSSGSEVEIIVIPYTIRIDSAAGHFPSIYVPFDIVEVAANTRLAVKIRHDVTSQSITYTGIKIMYLN